MSRADLCATHRLDRAKGLLESEIESVKQFLICCKSARTAFLASKALCTSLSSGQPEVATLRVDADLTDIAKESSSYIRRRSARNPTPALHLTASLLDQPLLGFLVPTPA